MRANEVLPRLPWRRRVERTGLVLSGGGARASFQIGALRYLYDEVGIRPEVITGTSAGSVLAAVLAQSDEPAEQRRLVGELARIWRGMRQSSDMFVPLDWYATLRERGPEWMAAFSRRQQRQGPLGRTFSRVASRTDPRPAGAPFAAPAGSVSPSTATSPADAAAADAATAEDGPDGRTSGVRSRLRTIGVRTRPVEDRPVEDRPVEDRPEDEGAWGSLGVVEFLSALREVGRARPDLEVILRGAERERSMYRLGPIVEQLLDPEVFRPARVAGSGMVLRVAVVSLESGELRYVTETGALLDRHGDPLGGEPVDLVDAVRASCAIPAVLPPVRLGDEHYVDGGVRETLPAEVAIEQLGVTRCYAVVASPPGVPREESYADKDMLSIVLRATAGIMSDEGLHDEVAWARRAGAVIIHPELDIHDVLTIDPGLTAISMDYGYMRAAEAVLGASAREAELTREIISLRKEIWRVENDLLGPAAREVLRPDLSELAALKSELRALVDQAHLTRLPPGARGWWRTFEAHPFDVEAEPDWS
ncbi:patatin-like phospholipase family protein [Georgenia sp. EYE_87]|uniref:patatin-like phospholipase family protein n=1 Tax=Georgenia sp. EYE_87 TaxID=2853448 RepID=UPI002004D80B|nr:patatin-like phospholipase family protein [Georgenia sp. EYE_87]MCK6211153.1 patatin-like phospholipase family protein [Georgenia sp. EYE_87]